MRRIHALESLEEAKRKGEADVAMFPAIDLINAIPFYYTTSSCTGRTSLFHDPGSKKDSGWLGKWHSEVKTEDVLSCLESLPPKGLVWFMHEPTILHVMSQDMEHAAKLVDLARNTGYKKVGILSYKEERVLVEICSSERIDAPLARDGRMIAGEEYVAFLVGLANSKFRKGMDRLNRLEKVLQDPGL